MICLYFKDCQLTVQCALHIAHRTLHITNYTLHNYTLHIAHRTLQITHYTITHCTVVQLDHRFLRFPTFTVCGRQAQRHLRLHRLSALFHLHSLVPFETCGEMKQKVNILRSQLLSAPPICLQSYTLCLVCTSTAHFDSLHHYSVYLLDCSYPRSPSTCL